MALEEIGEEIYQYVGTESEKNDIKNVGGKWIPYRRGKMTNVTVYEHVDSKDFVTGWYKTITKVRNCDGTKTNCARYFRRVGVKK